MDWLISTKRPYSHLQSIDRGDKVNLSPHDRSILPVPAILKMEPVETYSGTTPSRKVEGYGSRYQARNKLDEYYMKVSDGTLTEQRYEDWGRYGFCPECEENTLMVHDDYLCIKCRLSD